MSVNNIDGFILQLLKNDQVTVVLAEIISFADSAKWVRLLDTFERKRYLSYRFNADAQFFAARRFLAKHLLKNDSFFYPYFQYNEYGKPYIERSSLQFNWSFSRNLIAVAYSPKYQVGIDIEVTDQNFVYAELWEKVVADRSLAQTPENFFRFWTAREALSKCTGKGIDNSFFNTLSLSDKIFLFNDQKMELEQFKKNNCIISLATKTL